MISDYKNIHLLDVSDIFLKVHTFKVSNYMSFPKKIIKNAHRCTHKYLPLYYIIEKIWKR